MEPTKSFAVQHQIRQNAEEVTSFMSDMTKWEKEMGKRNNAILRKKGGSSSSSAPRVRNAGTVATTSSSSSLSSAPVPASTGADIANNPSSVKKVSGVLRTGEGSSNADSHTYDKGYKKWEKFDVDAALEDDEETKVEEISEKIEEIVIDKDEGTKKEPQKKNKGKVASLTPATIINPAHDASSVAKPVPRALGQAQVGDAEAAERERGNSAFKTGDFTVAVKAYTKCIGMKVRNYVAFSNRAMTYLKLKEYSKAEMDASCALKIEPDHLKSLLRRATARNSLGKHRAAMLDLLKAEELEPTNKLVKAELVKTRELLKNAVNRAPMIPVKVVWADGSDRRVIEPIAGPKPPEALKPATASV